MLPRPQVECVLEPLRAAALFPMPLLTVDVFRSLCLAYPAKKSIGCDAWSPRELAILPTAILALFVRFYDVVYAAGSWPLSFVNLIALLPKPLGGSAVLH